METLGSHKPMNFKYVHLMSKWISGICSDATKFPLRYLGHTCFSLHLKCSTVVGKVISIFDCWYIHWRASLVAQMVQNLPQLRRSGSILGSGRSPGGGHDNPLWYSCLENSMDRETWQAAVHGITALDTTERLTLFYIHWRKSYILLWNWWVLLSITYSTCTQ